VVADVPLVNPEKYAAAIEQKKPLLAGTSVNGKVVLVPLQAPVSARNRADVRLMVNTAATSIAARILKLRWCFIPLLLAVSDGCSIDYQEPVSRMMLFARLMRYSCAFKLCQLRSYSS
jgi:hypothetical protein